MLADSRRGSLLAISFAALLAAAPVHADQAQIDYRHGVMEAIGGHTQALGLIIRGAVAFDGDAQLHASAFEPLAKLAIHVFPESSKDGKTEALPAIWEKPADFKRAMDVFQSAAADMTAVAGLSPKEMAPAFNGLIRSCKSCHDQFRKD